MESAKITRTPYFCFVQLTGAARWRKPRNGKACNHWPHSTSTSEVRGTSRISKEERCVSLLRAQRLRHFVLLVQAWRSLVQSPQCFAFRVLCFVFCALRSAFSVTRSAFCVLRSVFCVVRSAFCVPRSAFCCPRSALCVQRPAHGTAPQGQEARRTRDPTRWEQRHGPPRSAHPLILCT